MKKIESTEVSPEVIIEGSGISLTGKSMMEDASSFYSEIHQWMEDSISSGQGPIQLDFKLTYFNSSTAKQLLKLLMNLDESETEGVVNWHCTDNNQVLMSRGKELEMMVDLPFNYLSN